MLSPANRPRYHWLTEVSEKFLNHDDLLLGLTAPQRVRVIADTAESLLKKPGFADKFEDYVSRGWYSLASPIWSNMGLQRGLPISCFCSYVGDSREEICQAQAEVSMMTSLGGGTAGYFGDVRGRGEPITNNGTSHGSVHFMQLFETLIKIWSQGNTRKGQFAAYLPIDHPDIEEFLTLHDKDSPIQKLSFGVCIDDYWMNKMIMGDTKCRSLWAKVLAKREQGFPYLFFTDNANRGAPVWYREQNYEILSSQLCVVGSERVVTSEGLRLVKDLADEGKKLTLFDGHKPVPSSPMRLIEKDAEVFCIETVDGRKHTVTGYHRVKTERGMVSALDLVPGDRIVFQRCEGMFGGEHKPEAAFLLGIYQGDGTQNKDMRFIDVWENDFDLLDEIEDKMGFVYGYNSWDSYELVLPGRGLVRRGRETPCFFDQKASQTGVKKKRIGSSKLCDIGFAKGMIPEWIWQGDKETQSQYLRGLFIADGTVRVGKTQGNPLQLSLASINKEFLRQIQTVLANLGITSRIHLLREAGENLLPDGKGGHALYKTKDCYRLCISNKSDAIRFEKMTGFLSRKGVFLEDREYQDNVGKFAIVASVTPAGREDVYCPTVDTDEHVWVCNGIVTSNCTEIMLPISTLESFVCCVSSLNMLYYDEWKNTDAVETMVYFLDAVLTEFIEKAKHIRFMERAVRFAERHRAIGIGWFGWHSLLQSKMIPFESMEAKTLNTEIAKTMHRQSWEASAKMAREYGEPDVTKGYGQRHATRLAIAPTKSSSFIIGQASEGIEPHESNVVVKDLEKVKHTVRNPHLAELFQSKGRNDASTWHEITNAGGSVQKLGFLSQHEKDVFKTFGEISQKEVVIQAAARQKWIDQGQSLNLMIHPSIPVKDVNALYIEGWRSGIKSLYYQKSVNAAQEFSRNILACKSCES
jgi:ribonucleoside-diphosphate reductase alpha chain